MRQRQGDFWWLCLRDIHGCGGLRLWLQGDFWRLGLRGDRASGGLMRWQAGGLRAWRRPMHSA